MTNDDVRSFLVRHRSIMTDVELADIAGVSRQALSAFINRRGGRLRIAAVHRVLGLEVETHVVKTLRPKDAL